ncbi:hypothetical protein [Acinetobacter soli]|uniref:hypothetical protein n=1 Tax=Acinetobacter soli TaxID=487316 RepID=UPI00125089A6|nr:hypothetical protein [Acinetobacter soli]
MDDDFDEKFQSAIEAGESNLHAKALLNNWCAHAEVSRFGGIGMIEASTGLPIGHSGVQCKFSKANSSYSWLLEDSIYDFYQNNCKNCDKRLPVNFPNILEIITPREKEIEERQRQIDNEIEQRKKRQEERKEERALLRFELSHEESFVLDLLDILDQEEVKYDDPRLEELANLAPEIFTRNVIDHLLNSIFTEQLPYSIHAARALLKAALEPNEKLRVALFLLKSSQVEQLIVDVILSNQDRLVGDEFSRVLHRFTSMAVEDPPSIHFGYGKEREINVKPIRQLAELRKEDIESEIDHLIKDNNPHKKQAAVKILLALENDTFFLKYSRSVISTLLRRHRLLPEERKESTVLYYFRKCALQLFKKLPQHADTLIQEYLADNSDTVRNESASIYHNALSSRFNQKPDIGESHRIAFNRLLWIAVNHPEDSMSEAIDFFRYCNEDFHQLAVDKFSDLIGAATILSQKYEDLDSKKLIDVPENFYEKLDQQNKKNSVHNLQGFLIKWAALGAKSRGIEGLNEFLTFYRTIPTTQDVMRGNMITHISELLTGIESLQIVLADWYSALMDESALVRARAVEAWENVPYKLIQNFPHLFFEAFSILLMDQYVIVHKAAARILRRRSFPEDKRYLIKDKLLNLILIYAQSGRDGDFLVDCIDVYESLCLSLEEMEGQWGEILSNILLKLEGDALYKATNQLSVRFRRAPNFLKVVFKSIQSEYTRGISIDRCLSIILQTSKDELNSCVQEIKNALASLKPFSRENFIEALVYITVLHKSGKYSEACAHTEQLLLSVPVEDRNKQWRLQIELILTALKVEESIHGDRQFSELLEQWHNLLLELEKEHEERTKLSNFSPSIFFKS